ncbi:beta-ketoacyl synthase N-terminal-like domain-containing protein [Colwellia psychrerythraea]|uniref:6-deoxyerythronolide-B synthase, 3-hydroxydecanoyl-(Acyl-carrier-protein) dehydratase n=1 Tax=Colwellia psychrerythraea TaxID=28229 RepID=A0A099L2B9_COLPS|nr:beta-ketoacyl synthase N-terminal-like domain-containing protein [Colwellia psychrerythraea]KGJ96018.1 6-deoxyerythronolide-B synthase, 3-hydroxydecanoyl-(acyl-carrier-protein) dehydratase [Colwellia psychrerythraea]
MENIAVVGIANLFPGSSAPEEFWQQLLNKEDCRSKATKEQMGVDPAKYTGKKGDTDKFYCVHGGYIRDFDFDASAFVNNDAQSHLQKESGLTTDYLNQLDDLNQWALYVTEQALTDAGYWGSDKLEKCGVILGNLSFPTKSSNHLFMPLYHQVVDDALKAGVNKDFQLSHFSDTDIAQSNVHADNALVAGYPAALLAKAAGLGGTHFALDAACASSCYSVKLACDYLHTGKADMMLAGAVSGADPMFVNMGFSIFQAYPANNIHAPFDKNSQGLFAGEGAGMMVLKRHSDAVRDGDKIHAIIKGGALSNDGKGEFVLSPNTKGQVLVYERAYENAGVDPRDVDYIECHATGTPKGDNVELGSMDTFFSRFPRTEGKGNGNKPLLGSVKSNLGHLLTAAGMPGMTKAIWALNQAKIPATINLNEPLSSKKGYLGGAQMPTDTIDWPVGSTNNANTKANSKPRTAGVSVFGFGGSNAHLVLQQPTQTLATVTNVAKAREPLAIIGMDAHFGAAKDLASFKTLIQSNSNTFRELPTKRWKGIEKNTEVMNALSLAKAPVGGYVEEFDIDFLRFKVPPNEQDCLIPQQLMMMKVADNAAKDAGLKEGSNVAVLVAMGIELELHQYRGRVNLSTQIEESLLQQGVSLSDEQRETLTNIAKDGVAHAAQLNQYTSFIGNIMASRISALWDFSGPAITLSAEENSVYRCVELAENLFQTSDIDAVIIASVDLAGSIENITLRQHYGPVSVDAQASANVLDKNHWLIGEGAAAFVVKPESMVSEQSIYATIDSISFVNGNDADAITKAATNALAIAGLKAGDINSVEAHASGFIVENRAENQALPKLYLGKTISSVKSNIGHTFNASGVASIVKSALLLNENVLDGNVLDERSAKTNTTAYIASHIAVNGLGKDESCAHLILSSSKKTHQAAPAPAGKQRPKLIKTITLGGKAIFDDIIEKVQSAEIAGIKQAFAQQSLGCVKQAVNVDNLTPKLLATPLSESITESEQANTALHANQSIQAKTRPTVVTGVQVKKTIHSQSKRQVPADVKHQASKEIFQESATHQAFLTTRQVAGQQLSKLIEMQANASAGLPAYSAEKQPIIAAHAPHTPELSIVSSNAQTDDLVEANKYWAAQSGFQIKGPAGYDYPPLQLEERFSQPENVIWDTADLVEFAEGDIAKVFGDEYKIIDSYSRRVRLPTTDYLLVSRVTELEATVNEYKKSYMCTEYDIPVDAPFLIDGQIPWSVSVESGQCDLLLISYIGIDFQAKGDRVYRLLDCQLTFLEEMAFGGETLRYEIHIDSYAKNGEQLLFFFHYDCYVGDKKVLIMRNGCAGFFTDDELKDGKGVIHNDKDKAEFTNAVKTSFTPFLNRPRDQYDYADMMKLVNGDVAGCFGSAYDQQGRNPSLKFSSEKFLMIERIINVDANGGHWGLGLLEGQKDLDPEHWYFPCHFKGDQVMAGSLMSEGCGQMAMFYMLSLGMHANMNNARFQPMPGESQTVRCRGQVQPQHNTLTYRMEVTEMGMKPYPYLKANIDILLDGKVVVDFKNLAMMITEQDENSAYPVTLPENVELVSELVATVESPAIESGELDERGINPFKHIERPLMKVMSDFNAPKEKGVTPIQHFEAPMLAGQNRVPNQAPFTPWHMFEFATGDISKCFGPDFDVYQGRIPPRTPCGDLQVVTQVVEVQGTRLDLKKSSSCIAEYQVPEDAWYFTKNSVDNWMPYSLIMEIALQPNGFISGYMGTTLVYPEKDLFFRNLDGSGDLLKQVDLRGKTIVNKSVLMSTTMAGGMIIQSFTFELYVKDESQAAQALESHDLFYKGTAVFGYFGADALTNQLGIDNGRVTFPWFEDNNTPKSDIELIDLTNKELALYQAPANKPHYKLAGGQMNFIDTVSIVEGGGKAGVAYVHGERTIDATDWFFRYHFHQDPVMPGSLGVEAIIELMQTYALKNDLGKGFTNPRFIAPATLVKWKYRGQITPLNKQMSLDVHITDIIRKEGEVRLVGDANLSKDGLRIYEVKDIVLSIIEAD